MEEYRLKIANMSKSFPGVKALDNIKLAVLSAVAITMMRFP